MKNTSLERMVPDISATEKCPSKCLRSVQLRVSGVVQGVGFRPFVYGLARRLGLCGYVLNDSRGVEIILEGENSSIERFIRQIETSPPPLAFVREVTVEELCPNGKHGFEIKISREYADSSVLISPDYATCEDCLQEMSNPNDRRYRYAFINCTNCGPRYTIIRGIPYDRIRTTMASFKMCDLCRYEYEDPLNRRFHTEPTCCPECGPRLWLTDNSGKSIDCDDPVRFCTELLAQGYIIAVKGLGGFHLACDASNDKAVRELRMRKARETKPLAVMIADLSSAKRLVHITEQNEKVLSSSERPILLVNKRDDNGLSQQVAPHSGTLGIMLPYTPLHHMLMQGPYPALVMTSGNVTEEPIAHRNDDALRRLSRIADFFLLHNRQIHIRTDDSVGRIAGGKLRFLRRSRGYAPFPVKLPGEASGSSILAVGAELNNTVCLTRGQFAFVSHHIGDLKNSHAYDAFLQAVEHLSNVLHVSPSAVACDMHPDYLSVKYAKERGLPVIEVQHHHAHIASVLAENNKNTEPVIGVSFDGLGWGDDGQVWGGEFLICDINSYRRVGHIEYLPLPGGDATTKKPYRMAYVYLKAIFDDNAAKFARRFLPMPEKEMRIVDRMIEQQLNTPLTSSAGRLFDAAASIIGVCHENNYEGQAPAELEGMCSKLESDSYPALIEDSVPGGTFVVRTTDLIRAMIEDLDSGASRQACAVRFHNSVARFISEACVFIRERENISTVALSGGVFINGYLLEKLYGILERNGFEVLLNSVVPAGDGGISLGQAAVATRRLTCV